MQLHTCHCLHQNREGWSRFCLQQVGKDRETVAFAEIRRGWWGWMFQTVIKLRKRSSKYKASHHVQMVLVCSGTTHLPALMQWKQKVFSVLERGHLMLDWVVESTQQRKGTTHLITETRKNSSLKVFVDLQHLSSQVWKGRLTNKWSICFHSDLWMACASACDSQMPGKTRLAHKKASALQKACYYCNHSIGLDLHNWTLLLPGSGSLCKSMPLPAGLPPWQRTRANLREVHSLNWPLDVTNLY